MVGWIALAVTLAIVAGIALKIDDWGRDWTENTASLDAGASNESLRPLILNDSPQRIVQQISDWASEQSRWELVDYRFDPKPYGNTIAHMNLTRRTALFRFVDDVTIEIHQDSSTAQSTVYATSRSRIGKGDLGQNPRNLIELVKAIRSANQAANGAL